MGRRFVIGDVHGCFKTLKQLVSMELRVNPEDEVYFLGDYIDRGPFSREVLDYIIDLKWQGYKIFPLCGNHENMLIRALEDERALDIWFRNGAEFTLKSFGLSPDRNWGYENLAQVPPHYITFMRSLPYYYELDNYILVHAGLNFRRENVFEDTDSMLWIRDFKYDEQKAKGKVIVHGHTPMPAISLKNNLRRKESKVLNLDAGCVYSHLPGYGYLMAMDLDSKDCFIQKCID